jgi:archaellum component FlaG (FlaF/FlaG flagellin family)
MAQRKPSAPVRTGSAKSAAKPGHAVGSQSAGARPPGSRPPGKKPGKSIVNQRQTPWGMIIAAVLVVAFAAGVITYAVTRSSGKSSSSAAKPASATAEQIAKIPGIVHKTIASRNHVTGVVNYGTDSPPFGGDHNQYWAQCTGIVYDHQLANENAVHTLEHGAIWITYRPGLDQASISALSNKVLGKNYMLLTPYAGLKSPISLQAWGYQLFVDSASDPRIDQFISDLRLNPNTVPEYGASCDDPQFQASKSTPGHPFNG